MRQRLTTRRLVAAPDESSGHNPNSPVLLYDLKPNARFVIGEEVIAIYSGQHTGMPVRGVVLGHCAEDRLWVQWPTELVQEDVSDVLPWREYRGWGVIVTDKPIAQARASRQADVGDRLEARFDRFGEALEDLNFEALEEEDEALEEEDEAPEEEDEDCRVQELLFEDLPEDQDPDEVVDVEPEETGEFVTSDDFHEDLEDVLEEEGLEVGPEEVTLIDLDSVCDEGYDQTEVIESGLQNAARTAADAFWGSEFNRPFRDS